MHALAPRVGQGPPGSGAGDWWGTYQKEPGGPFRTRHRSPALFGGSSGSFSGTLRSPGNARVRRSRPTGSPLRPSIICCLHGPGPSLKGCVFQDPLRSPDLPDHRTPGGGDQRDPGNPYGCGFRVSGRVGRHGRHAVRGHGHGLPPHRVFSLPSWPSSSHPSFWWWRHWPSPNGHSRPGWCGGDPVPQGDGSSPKRLGPWGFLEPGFSSATSFPTLWGRSSSWPPWESGMSSSWRRDSPSSGSECRPAQPSWGSMVADGRGYLSRHGGSPLSRAWPSPSPSWRSIWWGTV